MMTTQQIADRLTGLLSEGNFFGVYDELFHPTEVQHVEPQSAVEQFRLLTGVEQIKAKDMAMAEHIASTNGPHLGTPIVRGNAIALPYQMEAEMKDGSQFKLEEIIIYEVAEGKIISERFFY